MFNQLLNQLMQGMSSMTSDSGTASLQNSGLGGLGELLKNPAITGALSGVGGGLLSGLLFGNKNMRSIGAIGGAATLGLIATKAYQAWQANKKQSGGGVSQFFQGHSNEDTVDFDNLSPEDQEEHSRTILMAIIAAAKADGNFDERERTIIRDHIEKIGDADITTWVQQEINKPLDVNRIAVLATSPKLASEIYLASLIVIDDQNELEKNYLNALAAKMGLDPQLQKEIEQQLVNSGAK